MVNIACLDSTFDILLLIIIVSLFFVDVNAQIRDAIQPNNVQPKNKFTRNTPRKESPFLAMMEGKKYKGMKNIKMKIHSLPPGIPIKKICVCKNCKFILVVV